MTKVKEQELKQKRQEANRKRYEELLKQKDNAGFTEKLELELERTRIDDRLGYPEELHSMVKAKLELKRRITMK